MRYEFTLIDPDSGDSGDQWVLPVPVTVGRGMLCHISLDHGSISRKHCEFYEDAGGLHVRDMGSKNGVFVEGSRVDKAPVEVDSVVRLGMLPMRIRKSNATDSAIDPLPPRRDSVPSDQDETHAVRILPTDGGRYEIG